MVFIDDILIYLKISDERTGHLREVLEVLWSYELYMKLTKCELWLGKVAFLGHVLSIKGVSVDPQKIEVVVQWPRLKNVTEVRSSLGLAVYY